MRFIKRWWLLLALTLHASAGSTSPLADLDFMKRLLAFNDHYYRFFRDAFGCPDTDTTTELCTMSKATFNYPEFLNASKAAKELFPDGQ